MAQAICLRISVREYFLWRAVQYLDPAQEMRMVREMFGSASRADRPALRKFPFITGLNVGRESLPRALRAAVLKRDGRLCRNCGSSQYLEVDHIKPVALGGLTIESNLQVLCRSCNRLKGPRRGAAR